MEISTIGLDLAKNVFHAHGADGAGAVVFSKQLRRDKVLAFFAKQPACLVAMEACASAHYWAREIGKLGHTVRLIPPAYVKPFVKICLPDHIFTSDLLVYGLVFKPGQHSSRSDVTCDLGTDRYDRFVAAALAHHPSNRRAKYGMRCSLLSKSETRAPLGIAATLCGFATSAPPESGGLP